MGIRMAAPAFEFQDVFERFGVQVFSSNYCLYGDMSRRVMETLIRLAPEIEIYSIDEAFVRLEGFTRRGIEPYARHIRRTLRRWTGIPVSIGIGPTKTLTKLAAHLAKHRPEAEGVFRLGSGPESDPVLAGIDVEEVWGVGAKYAKSLRRHGVRTVRELRDAPDAWIEKHMTVAGLRTIRELRGEPRFELDEEPPPRQGITSSRSFGRAVGSLAELKEAVACYVSRAAEKLRAQQSVAANLHVFITTNSFRSDDPQYSNSSVASPPIPTANTPELIACAHAVLERIYRDGYRYKKAGVTLTGILPEDRVQMNLFVPHEPYRRNRGLMKTLDGINARWGSGTIEYAGAGVRKNWRMKRERKSPAYTTNWNELPVVRAR
jgi:DNA polymerase V